MKIKIILLYEYGLTWYIVSAYKNFILLFNYMFIGGF